MAITRSKTNLTIHYNGRHLREIKTVDLSYISDTKLYEEPEIIAMQLTHRDVQLGYFEYVQQRMQTLYSGVALTIQEEGLCNIKGELVIKYSRMFNQIISDWKQKGFIITEAKINFIVYWKKPEEEKEIKIALPEIMFRKNK